MQTHPQCVVNKAPLWLHVSDAHHEWNSFVFYGREIINNIIGQVCVQIPTQDDPPTLFEGDSNLLT